MNVIDSLNYKQKTVFDIIQKNGPLTKNQVIDLTNMKLSTLNRILQVLIDEKMIIETSTAESTGGRKPVLLDVNPEGFYIIGIDVSRTYVRVVITNIKLKIKAEKNLKDLFGLACMNEVILKEVHETVIEAGISKNSIIGAGISAVFNDDNMELLSKWIKEAFDVPVYIENGANAAAIAEYYYGSGKNKENMVYINCGVGIRTGVISGGRLINSAYFDEDAFGHMTVDIDGERCWCGNYGCVESYASISRIAKRFISEIKKGKAVFINKELENIDYIDVCRMAEEENRIAMDIIMDAAVHFGVGLANYIRLFDPQLIILSGPLIKHSHIFYEACRETALEKSNLKYDVDFEREGYFHDKSMAVGAAAVVIEKMLKEEFV